MKIPKLAPYLWKRDGLGKSVYFLYGMRRSHRKTFKPLTHDLQRTRASALVCADFDHLLKTDYRSAKLDYATYFASRITCIFSVFGKSGLHERSYWLSHEDTSTVFILFRLPDNHGVVVVW